MVPNKLREYRVRLGLSQIELMELTGVAQATISNIESGNRTPSYLTRQRLAEALRASVEDVFPGAPSLRRESSDGSGSPPAAPNRLREYRTKAGLSQIELSVETGVAQATISNIEAGNRTPSYLTTQRLADALGATVSEVFPNARTLRRTHNHDGESDGTMPNRLREFRVAGGMSQIELSQETGVAQATISNIEAGNRTPSALTCHRLAEALGKPVEAVFPRVKQPAPDRGRTTLNLVQEHRIRAGLTQTELSDRTGIAQATISNIESGRREPARTTKRVLAEALGVRVEVMFPAGSVPGLEPDVAASESEGKGTRLAEVRTARAMSLRDLAIETSLDEHLLRRFELGTASPSPPHAKLISLVLGVSVEDLFSGSGEVPMRRSNTAAGRPPRSANANPGSSDDALSLLQKLLGPPPSGD